MGAAQPILDRLARREPVGERVMIVVAHPDDETIGLGAQLCRIDNAVLVHVTDGAPRDGYDARNYGFTSVAAYAAARRAELAAALRAGGADRIRTETLGIADKEACRDLVGVTHEIAGLLRSERPELVFTHAYEGGHPDHDAAAFAVHAACRLAEGQPVTVEMPLYRRQDGSVVNGMFLPRDDRGEMAIHLDDEDQQRKRAMIDCFTTQLWLLQQFDIAVERFRLAPEYDFTMPPHAGELHYETLGWGITGAAWRRAAGEALTRLGLA